MAHVIGLDGGGSKSLAVLVDSSGQVLGTGLGGPTHILYNSGDAVRESIGSAVQQACSHHQPSPQDLLVTCGIPPEFAYNLAQQFGLGANETRTEYELGMASVMQTYGILVLSGTGSVICGGNQQRMHFSMGGQGPLFADEGSGFHIGQLGLRAAFRSHYGSKYRTVLAEKLPTLYGAPNLHDLFIMLYRENGKNSRKMIARAARTVNEAAEEGDLVAVNVLCRAAQELAQMLPDVVAALNLRQPQVPMVASGSVALKSKIYWRAFCEQAQLLAPNLQPMVPTVPPACGAAMLGLQRQRVPWTTELLETMADSFAKQEKY